jgi:hypothetical protein
MHQRMDDDSSDVQLMGLGRTASELTSLLFDFEAGQAVDLRDDRVKLVIGRASEFLSRAHSAKEKLDEFVSDRNLSYFVGSDAVDVTSYRYYLEARRLLGGETGPVGDELSDYLKVLEALSGPDPVTERQLDPAKVHDLAVFFRALSGSVLARLFPLRPTEEELLLEHAQP